MTLLLTDEEEETDPQLPTTTTPRHTAALLPLRRRTSPRIQGVPGHTPNREYPFSEAMPVLLQLRQATERYYEDEGVIPSAMHLTEAAYSEVVPFLRTVPMERNGFLCYWTEIYGPNIWMPIVVSIQKSLSPHTVKCIGRSQTGSLPKVEQQSISRAAAHQHAS